MTEYFVNPAPERALYVPAAETVDLNSDNLEWQATESEGFWLKPLFESSSDGLRMWLMKVDPGGFSPEHAHKEIEHIYVLVGFLTNKKPTSPTQRSSVPDAQHEAGSTSGALMIVSYAPKK